MQRQVLEFQFCTVNSGILASAAHSLSCRRFCCVLRHVLSVRVSPYVQKTEGTARPVPGMWMTRQFRLLLWNGVGLVIRKVPEFQLSETCGLQPYW